MSGAAAGEALVALWSREWREVLPVRAPVEQAHLNEEACRAIAAIQLAASRVEGGVAGRAGPARAEASAG